MNKVTTKIQQFGKYQRLSIQLPKLLTDDSQFTFKAGDEIEINISKNKMVLTK